MPIDSILCMHTQFQRQITYMYENKYYISLCGHLSSKTKLLPEYLLLVNPADWANIIFLLHAFLF